MVLPRALANFNRYATNPAAGLFAGRVPGFAILRHKGRKSGREYRTPVSVFRRDGVYRIALTYGRDVDWLKNISAAGVFTLRTRGGEIELTDPVVRHDPSARWAPAPIRLWLKALSAEYYVEARPNSPLRS
ncbi:deazaflavin-dependent oxidoreductase (nitroreductase family) [Nocardia tenerifensis]|uniref:Deazaflavin-dependent oxidoreductase (Nitroreductase family) n=1 Tax=Nocardia tenerifensis TaxID=228006 RepID=A0A318JYU7_9NOCA|nr:nitroreductase family deazaflavin-dependent oxidoreductase [Nocardia tenerifensis]PXX59268.1 deazaflavin-dependent oxidoreductase (nitroreductase family) [Nocardia tenerifensis]